MTAAGPPISGPGSGRPSFLQQLAELVDDPAVVRLEGLHCVKHALRFGADVPLLVTSDRARVLALAADVAPDVWPRLAGGLVDADADLHPGLARLPELLVVGLARRPTWRPAVGPASSSAAPTILLEDPRNLGNLGAVVRVAAGFGARAVRTTGTVDPWHPTVVRAAAGLHFALPVERVDGLDAAVAGRGPVLALDPAGEDLRRADVPGDAVLAFGSERRGLSAELRRRADHLVAIPMRDGVSSYNLATSVAVALFAWSIRG